MENYKFLEGQFNENFKNYRIFKLNPFKFEK